MDEQALTGIKVLDLTHYTAGPYCTKLLADYGADIIKVERPGKGDGARQAGPFPGDLPDPEKSGLFLYLNTNKRGITLNLKAKTGVDIFKELVKQSDILVENFSPRVMPSLGLDYQTLKKVNPQLVMCSISNFGATGPYRDWKASEIVLYALSGQMSRQGDPDREPLKHALNIFQYFSGEIAAIVILASAVRGTITGWDGEHIDISILETVQGDIQNAITTYGYSGYTGGRATVKNYPLYPFGGFPTNDGYVVLQGHGGAERWVPRLFAMIGKPELKDDPRFSTPENRVKHNDEFNPLLYSWLIDHTKQEVFDEAAKVRYPSGPVYNIGELLDNPHYQERGYFTEIEHPVAGKLTYPGAPFKLAEAGYAIRRPAPLLGQHNREIYCGLLGYSEHDLSILRSRGVI
ncbi:CaiB/BaiF CoA transferase family protein [Chloroflexota bacterium]